MELVIPCYNEAERLPHTIDELRSFVAATPALSGLQAIVVDNASTDETAKVARRSSSTDLPVQVIHCATPGKGAAVREGVAATSHDLVGFMDADCATGLHALETALKLHATGANVAIASRGLPESMTMVRTSAVRALGARIYRRCASQIVPGIRDTQCGFKTFDGSLARNILPQLQTTGFSFDVELLARMRHAGARIVEFPVIWTDVPGSTFSPRRHGAAAFRELAQIRRYLREDAKASEDFATHRPADAPLLSV